jgi:hypothetical protein
MKKDQMDLLHFKQRLAECLMYVGSSVSSGGRKRGRPQLQSPSLEFISPEIKAKYRPVDSNPIKETRKDNYGHFTNFDKRKEAIRYKHENCKGRTHVLCMKCNVHLCFTPKKKILFINFINNFYFRSCIDDFIKVLYCFFFLYFFQKLY